MINGDSEARWTGVIGAPENNDLRGSCGGVGAGLKSGFAVGVGGTNIGNMTANAGLAAAFDGGTSETHSTSAAVTTSITSYVGKDYSAAPEKISKVTVYGSNNLGYTFTGTPSVTVNLYGKNGSAPASATDGTLLGTITFTDTANESTGRDITSSDPSTDWDYVFVSIPFPSGAGGVYVAELEFFEPAVTPAMTLVSEAFTVDAAYDTASLGVWVTENEASTANTDFTLECSRDNGTTWTAATLALEKTYASGMKFYLQDDLDISGQPSGTELLLRFKTPTTKDIYADAWICGVR